MPPTPKGTQSSARKPGAQKAKGAARAKSGCYTCRIRRKKCDEEKSDRGSCKTCDRLRLECLGYGNKRPDWLRENHTVVDIRERIKRFLASQGMIKGHSGPTSRDMDQEPSFLTLRPAEPLRTDCYSSPESETSTLRSGCHRSLSPGSRRHPAEVYPWVVSQPAIASSYSHDEALFLHPRPPAVTTYIEPYSIDEHMQEQPGQAQYILHQQPTTFYPFCDPIADYYIAYVFEVQYLLANRPNIKQIVLHSVQTHPVSKEIAQILSELHYGRRRLPYQTNHIPPILHYLKRTGTGTLDDAMAVLHSVSVYLFNGGDGAWDECIDFAAKHVQMMLNTTFYNISNPLQFCDEKTAFVIKTAVWFDVLASITTERSPRLQPVVDRLFGPCRTHLLDLDDLVDQCSMLSPMGCENDVVWAISEISNLADWKRQQKAKGHLSVPELVSRSIIISRTLDNPICNQPCRDDQEITSQYSASNIFRAAAHLYLATVVSGDYPLVPEVSRQAQRVYDAIRTIPERELQPVVRSTVFAFFLCGCFLTELEPQKYIRDTLLIQERSTEIGNSGSVVNLLDFIWEESNRDHSREIPWRSTLKERHILLV